MNSIWKGDFTGLSPHGAVEYDAGNACDAVVNLTPHPLSIDFGGFTLKIPVHGAPARVEACEMEGESVRICMWVPDCLVPHNAPAYEYSSNVVGLPEAVANGAHYHVPVESEETRMWHREKGPRIWFVVSLLTGLALRGSRNDLLVPGAEIRDSAGCVIGCKGLRRIV